MSSNDQSPRRYLTFTLHKEVFAVPVGPIREIIEYPAVTEIPLAPEFLRGVINLRGSVVPLIDIAARFGRGPSEITWRTCVIVFEASSEDSLHQLLGIMVDTVHDVLDVDPAQVEPRPEFGTVLRTEFVAGMINRNGKFVVVLDIDKVLNSHELRRLIDQTEMNPQAEPASA
ncbi:chemotaxis protein CheW [Uliginosibacterium sp. TH139]|uniref:chemotaxis protein CheW n=1 Tax=Uliginosibacterium sp. TH139 TaxID=2067453 RepID=UPI000C7C8816|nr:chemotaxis protein CheW [Uliginosibacterium sp. TH139]PLK48477.1 chemotaxis protein CheW [Uliginosibacterium sp. TH139]